MSKNKLSLTLIMVGAWLGFSSHGITAEEPIYTSDRSITFLGGVGYAWLKSNEITYDDIGRISQLIWKTEAPVFTASLAAEIAYDFKLMANAEVGLSGNSNMKDYDWLDLSPSPNFEDWDHLSVHPDTNLNRYLNLDIAVGRDFVLDDAVTINLHGGLKYTNVKWTARGGSFIYSENSFRDTTGSFQEGERSATFEQRYTALFLGAEVTALHGDWTVSGLVRGGTSVSASDTDHHWVRGIRFERDYSAIPFVSLGARVDYSLSQRSSLFLGVNFDKYFQKRGDTNVYNIETGGLLGGPFVDGAGSNLVSTTINAGLKLTF